MSLKVKRWLAISNIYSEPTTKKKKRRRIYSSDLLPLGNIS